MHATNTYIRVVITIKWMKTLVILDILGSNPDWKMLKRVSKTLISYLGAQKHQVLV